MTIYPERMLENPHYLFSPAIKGVILKGLEEVIGQSDTDVVLKMSGLPQLGESNPIAGHKELISYHDLTHIHSSLESLYGWRGGQGVAWKMGRAYFTIGLRTYGKKMGLLDLEYRLLPLSHKLKAGLQRFARLMSWGGDSTFRLEEDRRQYYWIIENCPFCWQRHADHPICHTQVGMLQEYFYWASGGKNYNLKETQCIAAGAEACVIAIDKQPFE